MQSVLLPMIIFAKTCFLGKFMRISFVDSTPIRVCENKRINRNKVFKGVATTGKSTMGWFHGLLTTDFQFLYFFVDQITLIPFSQQKIATLFSFF